MKSIFVIAVVLAAMSTAAHAQFGSAADFERALRASPSNPEFAAGQACSRVLAAAERARCVEGLRAEIEQAKDRVRHDAEVRRASDIAEADARDAVAVRKFDAAYGPVAAAYITTGDVPALNAGCFKTGDAEKCMNRAFGERVAALKAGRVQPMGCREVGLAKGYFMNGVDPMLVSLDAPKAPGIFLGEVTQIEGRKIAIYDVKARRNAIVSIDGAKVFNGGQIAVGATVVGYGKFTGSVQGRLISGAPSTIATIAAECVGRD